MEEREGSKGFICRQVESGVCDCLLVSVSDETVPRKHKTAGRPRV